MILFNAFLVITLIFSGLVILAFLPLLVFGLVGTYYELQELWEAYQKDRRKGR